MGRPSGPVAPCGGVFVEVLHLLGSRCSDITWVRRSPSDVIECILDITVHVLAVGSVLRGVVVLNVGDRLHPKIVSRFLL